MWDSMLHGEDSPQLATYRTIVLPTATAMPTVVANRLLWHPYSEFPDWVAFPRLVQWCSWWPTCSIFCVPFLPWILSSAYLVWIAGLSLAGWGKLRQPSSCSSDLARRLLGLQGPQYMLVVQLLLAEARQPPNLAAYLHHSRCQLFFLLARKWCQVAHFKRERAQDKSLALSKG